MEFIKLHNADNNSTVIIRIELIAVIDTDTIVKGDTTRTVSTIFLKEEADMKEFKVNETPERIYEMIEKLKQ